MRAIKVLSLSSAITCCSLLALPATTRTRTPGDLRDLLDQLASKSPSLDDKMTDFSFSVLFDARSKGSKSTVLRMEVGRSNSANAFVLETVEGDVFRYAREGGVFQPSVDKPGNFDVIGGRWPAFRFGVGPNGKLVFSEEVVERQADGGLRLSIPEVVKHIAEKLVDGKIDKDGNIEVTSKNGNMYKLELSGRGREQAIAGFEISYGTSEDGWKLAISNILVGSSNVRGRLAYNDLVTPGSDENDPQPARYTHFLALEEGELLADDKNRLLAKKFSDIILVRRRASTRPK